MAYPNGSLPVTGGIGTTSQTDTYPTHFSELGKGGLKVVDTVLDLNDISVERREFGMLVAVVEDSGRLYQLKNIAMGGSSDDLSDDTNWIASSSLVQIQGFDGIDVDETTPGTFELRLTDITPNSVSTGNITIANAPTADSDAVRKDYVDGLVVGVFRPAGNWDASSNTFPTTGTGTAGAIRRGDTYVVSVAGNPFGGSESLDIGDSFYALVPNPGQTVGNWAKFEANTAQATASFRGTLFLYNTTGTNTNGTMTQKSVTDALATKQDTLVSGTNIKTLYSTTLLGSGDYSPTTDVIPEGSNNKFVINGTAPATAASGRLSYANTFSITPNTNSEFVWDDGYFASNGTVNSPVNLDNHILSTVTFIGDSFTANYGLTNANQGFVNKVGYYKGFKTITNSGVSGSTITGKYKGLYGGLNTKVAFVGLGINDYRQYGLTGLPAYLNFMTGYLTALNSNTEAVKGQTWTKTTPTDWTPTNIFFDTTTGSKTTVNNSPATMSVTGDVIYVNVAYEVAGDATYTITIDGVSQGTFTANSSNLAGYPTPTAGSEDTNYYPFTHRFKTTYGLHSVVIQKTGGTTPLRLIGGLSNGKIRIPYGNKGTSIYVRGTARMTAAGYVTWGGNDAICYAYNNALNDLCTTLADDGFNIQYIEVNKWYDPNLSGNVQADGLHPTAQGDTYIAKGDLDAMATYNLRDRQLIQNTYAALKGTANYLPKYTGGKIGQSSIFDSGTALGVNNTTLDKNITVGWQNSSSSNGLRQYTTNNNNEWFDLYSDGGRTWLQTAKSGAGVQRPIRIDGGNVELQAFGATFFTVGSGSSTFTNSLFLSTNSVLSTGDFTAIRNTPTINHSGTATHTGYYYSPFIQAQPAGTYYSLNLGLNSAANNQGTHTYKFRVNEATGFLETASGATFTGEVSVATATLASSAVRLDQLQSYVGKDNNLTKTANYTVLTTDYGQNGTLTLFADATSGAVTITLESASTMVGKTINVIKTDNSANSVTIKGNGTTNINATNTLVLSSQYSSATIKSNSTQYYVI